MDEQRWIASILAGDEQSFSCLVAKYEKMAYTLAFRMMGNREEAEEVVQDAFLKMYRALPEFRFGSKFSTWFYRIVYRTALTALRNPHFFADLTEEHLADPTVGEVEAASRALECADCREVVDRVLQALAPDERLLLTLYYLDECSVDEICRITDLTASNVKVKLFRARKRFYGIVQDKMNLVLSDLI